MSPANAASKPKILFLAAEAPARGIVKYDEEIKAIEEALHRTGDAFELVPVLAVRRSEIERLLDEHAPRVVHFSCHGTTDGELVLVGDYGEEAPLGMERLERLLRTYEPGPSLVALSACYSGRMAEAVVEVVDFAIGVEGELDVGTAVSFWKVFYANLSQGHEIGRVAYERAVASVSAPSGGCPLLFRRSGSVDGPLVVRYELAPAPAEPESPVVPKPAVDRDNLTKELLRTLERGGLEPWELRAFLQRKHSEKAIGPGSNLSSLSEELASLRRRGLLDAALILTLQEQLPSCREQLARIARAWG